MSLASFGWSALGLFASVLGCGCLVTDQVELPAESNAPPIVLTPSDLPNGSIIRFDATKVNELRIPLQVRDEDTMETLKLRLRVTTGNEIIQDFNCQEQESVGTGVLIRSNLDQTIAGTLIRRGACTRIDIVVSSVFVPCSPNRDKTPLFDVTTDQNNEDLGRARFWVWEVSNDALTSPEAALDLLNTCPQTIDRTTPPQTPTTPATTGTMDTTP